MWLNGKELDPDVSRKVRDHSPGGFEWGYLGSGPAQLALSICLELWPDVATRLYQDFKKMYIAPLKKSDIVEVNLNVGDFERIVWNAREEKKAQDELWGEIEKEKNNKDMTDELPF